MSSSVTTDQIKKGRTKISERTTDDSDEGRFIRRARRANTQDAQSEHSNQNNHEAFGDSEGEVETNPVTKISAAGVLSVGIALRPPLKPNVSADAKDLLKYDSSDNTVDLR